MYVYLLYLLYEHRFEPFQKKHIQSADLEDL